MRVTVARSLADLESIVPAWEALARDACEPNPFYEHWMLLPALRAFGGQDVRVVLVWRGEQLAALFPFRRLARYKGLPASALTSWLHAHCLLGTPLVRADAVHECLDALFAWRDASLIEFCYLPAGEPFHRALAAALAARGLSLIVNRAWSRGLLRKNRATISGQLRRQFAKKERRLAERGRFAHVTLGPHDDIGRWIEDFLRLEAGGWKGREGSAMACTEVNRRYATEIFTAAFRRGRLLMCGLDFDGRPIGRRSSFIAGAGSYAFKTAYDESLAEFSPGVMLELANIRQLDAAPGIEWMDSFTEDANLALDRMWPDKRAMESLAVPVGAWGGVTAATLPALRWVKRRLAFA
jgi:CelD/BcsL family acetyltransferase involved in cellulose biosynthesis